MEDKHTLTVDDIVTSVCNHYEVSATSINSRSRKHELVVARQVSMYLVQKYTRIPTSRIGKMIGNRDHSTVIHSCTAVENLLKANHAFAEEIASIENSFKLKKA
jgi:chromosomal replication initiator protein